jgi:hypothetical protein
MGGPLHHSLYAGFLIEYEKEDSSLKVVRLPAASTERSIVDLRQVHSLICHLVVRAKKFGSPLLCIVLVAKMTVLYV